MNCKPDDLCVIVRGFPGWSDHCIDRMVTVRKISANVNGAPAWTYEPPVFTKDGRPFDLIEDSFLRPITPPSGSVTTEEVKELFSPSPAKESEKV